MSARPLHEAKVVAQCRNCNWCRIKRGDAGAALSAETAHHANKTGHIVLVTKTVVRFFAPRVAEDSAHEAATAERKEG